MNYKKNVWVKSKNKLRFKKLQMLFDDASMSPSQQDSNKVMVCSFIKSQNNNSNNNQCNDQVTKMQILFLPKCFCKSRAWQNIRAKWQKNKQFWYADQLYSSNYYIKKLIVRNYQHHQREYYCFPSWFNGTTILTFKAF